MAHVGEEKTFGMDRLFCLFLCFFLLPLRLQKAIVVTLDMENGADDQYYNNQDNGETPVIKIFLYVYIVTSYTLHASCFSPISAKTLARSCNN